MRPWLAVRELSNGLIQYDFALERGRRGDRYELLVVRSEVDNEFDLRTCSSNY